MEHVCTDNHLGFELAILYLSCFECQPSRSLEVIQNRLDIVEMLQTARFVQSLTFFP